MNVINQQKPSSDTFLQQYRNGPILSGGVGTPVDVSSNIPPPLPPRTSHQAANYLPFNVGYGGMTGGYGFGNAWNYRNSALGAYNPYGGYRGYSSMYPNTFQNHGYGNAIGGPSGDVEDRFIQFAEESSRPAFQSIESVVQTFSSIAILLESTHFAITNSFRAILSVAENIGKTRNMFREIMGAFALARFFKWLYRKVTYMIGLNPDDPSTEQIWRKTATESINKNKGSATSWPILLFLSLLVAIPYVINRLMSNIQKKRENEIEDPRQWFRYNEPVYSAVALYNFQPINRDELSIKPGQKIWLAPQSVQPQNLPGWSRASDNLGKIGLIPTNYVKVVGQLGKKPEDSIGTSGIPSSQSHSLDSTNDSSNELDAKKDVNQILSNNNTVS